MPLFNSPGNVIPLPATAAAHSMCNIDVARTLPSSPVTSQLCVAFLGESCEPLKLSDVEQADDFVAKFGPNGTGQIVPWDGSPVVRVDIVVFSSAVQHTLHWKSPKGRVSDERRRLHEQLTRTAQVMAAWGVRVVTTKWLVSSVSTGTLKPPDKFDKKLKLGIQTYVPKSLPEVHNCAWLHTPSIVVGHEVCILWRTKEQPTPHWRRAVCTDYNPQERYFTVQAQDTQLFTDLPLDVMGDMRVCRDVMFDALSRDPRRLLGCSLHVLCPSLTGETPGQQWVPAIVYAFDEGTSEFCVLLGQGDSVRNAIKADLRYAPVMCKGVGLPWMEMCDQDALLRFSEGDVIAVATEVMSDEDSSEGVVGQDSAPPADAASSAGSSSGAASRRGRGRPRGASKAVQAMDQDSEADDEDDAAPAPRARGRGRPPKSKGGGRRPGAKAGRPKSTGTAPTAAAVVTAGVSSISARVVRELGDTLQTPNSRLADDAVATEVLEGAPLDEVPPPLDSELPLADLLPRHVTGLMPSLFDPREPTAYLSHAPAGVGAVLPSLPRAQHATHTQQPHSLFHSGAASLIPPFAGSCASSPAVDGAAGPAPSPPGSLPGAGDSSTDGGETDSPQHRPTGLPLDTLHLLYDATVDDDAQSVQTEAAAPLAMRRQWALQGADGAQVEDPETATSTVDMSDMPQAGSLATATSSARAMHVAVSALATMACDSALLGANFDLNQGRRRFMDKYLSTSKASSAFLTEYHSNKGEGVVSDSGSESDDADSLLGRVPRWVAAKRSLDSERRHILHGMRSTIGALTAHEPADAKESLEFHGFQARDTSEAAIGADAASGVCLPFHSTAADKSSSLGQALLWHGLGRHLDLRHNWPTESMRRADALRDAQHEQQTAVVHPVDKAAPVPIDGCIGTVAVRGVHPLSDPITQPPSRFLPSWTGKLQPLPEAVAAFVGMRQEIGDGMLPPASAGCVVSAHLPCDVTRALPSCGDLPSALGASLLAWLHVPLQGEEAPTTPTAAWDFYNKQHGEFCASLPVGLPTGPRDQVLSALKQVLGLPDDAHAEAKRAMLQLQRFAQSSRVSLQLVSAASADRTLQLFVDVPGMSDSVDMALAAQTCVQDHGTVGAACEALRVNVDHVATAVSPAAACMQLAAREARLQWVLPGDAAAGLVRSCWRSQAHPGVDRHTPVLTLVCGPDAGQWIPVIPRFLAAARAHRVREMAAMRVRGAVLRTFLANETNDAGPSAAQDVLLEATSALAREAIGGGISPLFPSRVAPLVSDSGCKLDGVTLGEYRDLYPVDFPNRFLLARRGEFHDGAAEHEEEEDALSRRRSARKRTSTQREGYDDAALEAMLASGDSSADSDDGASDASDVSAGGKRLGGKKRGQRGSGPSVPLPEGGWPLVAAKELQSAGKPLYVRSLFTHLMGRLGKSGVKWEVRVRGLMGSKMRYEGCFDNEMEAARHADSVVRAAYAEVAQPVPLDLVNFDEEGQPLLHTKAAMQWYGKVVTLADIASDPTAQELFKPRGSWTILQQHQLPVYFSTRRKRMDFWPVWGQTVDYSVDNLPTKMKKIHDKYQRKLRGETDDGKRGKKRGAAGPLAGRGSKAPREQGEWKLPTKDYVSHSWLVRSDVHISLVKREKPPLIPETPPAWLANAISRAQAKGGFQAIIASS